ncbi:GNAT family N-acetyltransferase [Streptomyces sp. AM6-12]|uniref:GNAT family N-acetyltransferase n=1 Tax=Streptomyces sp. AM6-12 TaxID=3345149 RepID=UPI0037A3CBC1
MSVDAQHVALRTARPEDAEAVAEIWYRGWCDGHLGNVPEALVAVRTRESFTERAAHRLCDTTVAVADGEVAGFVMVVGDEVEQVYVSERHRGSGVAARLLGEAECLVAAAGHRRAWLAVVPGNARARRFYDRNGWTDEGPIEDYAPHDQGQVPVPVHRYVKRLAAGA